MTANDFVYQLKPSAATATTLFSANVGEQIYGTLYCSNNDTINGDRIRVALKPNGQSLNNNQYVAYDVLLAPNYPLYLQLLAIGSGDSVVVRSLYGSTSFNFTGNKTNVIPVTQPPINVVQPYIVGNTTVGSTLSCYAGAWANNPTSYSYQWYHANSNSQISGATTNQYVLITSDVGNTIDCRVTATNVWGNAAINTNATITVTEPLGVHGLMDFAQSNQSGLVATIYPF